MGSRKRNTEIRKIENKSARHVCFSKRRGGLFRKSQEYHKVSGSLVAVLVFSPTGRSYVHGSPSFDPIVDYFLNSSAAASSMMTVTTSGTSSTPKSCDTESSVSDSASTDVGLKEQVEAINVEGSNNLEELLEMKRKLEEVRKTVLYSFADSLIC